MVLAERLVSGVGVSFGWFFGVTLLFTVLVCFVIRSLLIRGTSVCSCLMCHASYMYKCMGPSMAPTNGTMLLEMVVLALIVGL